jgi:hypothetical protein
LQRGDALKERRDLAKEPASCSKAMVERCFGTRRWYRVALRRHRRMGMRSNSTRPLWERWSFGELYSYRAQRADPCSDAHLP